MTAAAQERLPSGYKVVRTKVPGTTIEVDQIDLTDEEKKRFTLTNRGCNAVLQSAKESQGASRKPDASTRNDDQINTIVGVAAVAGVIAVVGWILSKLSESSKR